MATAAAITFCLSGPEHLLMEIWNPATNTCRPVGRGLQARLPLHGPAASLRPAWSPPATTATPTKDPGRQTDVAVSPPHQPAYLFAPGGRPTITDVHRTTATRVNPPAFTPTPRSPCAAPAASADDGTHSTDMQQRHVELLITPTATGSSRDVSTGRQRRRPGHYMLFALDATGKSSIAKWIVVGGSGWWAAPPRRLPSMR